MKMAVFILQQDQRKGIANIVQNNLKVYKVRYCFGKIVMATKEVAGFVKSIIVLLEHY